MNEHKSALTLDELEILVASWAKDRGLIKRENSSRQMLKVIEELGELAGSMAKNNQDGIVDGLGDVLVTIIILSYQLGLSPAECLQVAYDEIKNRKGNTVNGVFIKNNP